MRLPHLSRIDRRRAAPARRVRLLALIVTAALAPASCSARPHDARPTSTGAPTSTAAAAPTTAGPTVPAALLGHDITTIPTDQRVMALTFDGGADADGVTPILGTLAAHHITATFFLTGQFATNYPDRVRTIAAMGYRIGNHSATHPHMLTKTDADLRAELATAERQLRAAGAADPHPLFRFPYGECDARTIATVNAAGYLSVRWTVDSLGWEGLRGRATEQAVRDLIDRVVAAARPGGIVLMHLGANPDDGSLLDAAALPSIVDRLAAMGYSFVTLDALTRA